MTDFEDNNPFAGSDRRLSSSSSGINSDFASLNIQNTTGSAIDDDDSRSQTSIKNDHETENDGSATSRRTYSSRVEQILYEYPTEEITITEAGKSREGSSRGVIVYTIQLREIAVRRRYSEFESLRNTLAKLFPTLIIPPIPEKHSMSDYAAAPTKAKEDTTIIEHRRRMLAVFLNRCKSMKQVRQHSIYQKFLDPNVSWNEVLSSPPVSLLPKQILKAPPLDPASESIAHTYLPIPSSSATLRNQDDPIYQNAELHAKEYENLVSGSLEKVNRRIIKRYAEQATDLSELGAKFNAFSLEEHQALASAIEKVGQAIDNSYISTEALVSGLSTSFTEPLGESAQFASIVRSVLKFRKQKALQYEITTESLASKKATLETLERTEQEAQRINAYLHRDHPSLNRGEPVNSSNLSDSSTLPSASVSLQKDENQLTSDNDTTTLQPASSESTEDSTEGAATAAPARLEDSSALFPPTHADTVTVKPPSHKKKRSVFSIPGISKLNNAIHSIVDNDPETTRRNNIGKTREQISQLEYALAAAKEDVALVSESVKQDLLRYQGQKEEDLKKMMVSWGLS
jgi:hypothetical protein